MKSGRTLITALFATVVVTAIAQETTQKPTTTPGPPVTTIKVPPPPPVEDPNAFRVSSDVELVLLDVSVKDDAGGFVSGLKKEDFKIFENKVEQRVSVFQSQDVPVTVGLIVDNSGSIRRKKPEIVTAALTFVKNSNPSDEVFVVNFNDRVLMGLPDDMPFSGNINMLRQALLSNPAQGRTALYDALKTGLEHLDKGRLDKKTLVLVSDGGDNMSQTTKDEIMRMAEQSHATIYAVGLYDPDAKDKDPGFLKDLARITGGEAFLPHSDENIVQVCDKVAKDIRNRYTIGYVPSNREYDGKVRRLRVLASAPAGKKYQVRTRTHYVAAKNGGETSARSRKEQR